MSIQIWLALGTILAFFVLGFAFHKSIKKYDAQPKKKSKKGRSRYLPQAKNPGR
ncbi:MAG: hypothetical protein N2645_16970 [Clostridia bacterium]|nr:hypothetical protein [Clostridia bacterium]